MNKILGFIIFVAIGATMLANASIKPLQSGAPATAEAVGQVLMTVLSVLFAIGLFAVAAQTKNALGKGFCFFFGVIFALPALLIVLGFAGSSIGAAITGFFAGFGKVIMTVLGIVIAIGVVTYLNNRDNRRRR